MNCPRCNNAETRVLRSGVFGPKVMRQRRCEACQVDWPTEEVRIGECSPVFSPAQECAQVDISGEKGGLGGSSLNLFSGSDPDSLPVLLEICSEDRHCDGPKKAPALSPGFVWFWANYPKERRGSKSRAWRAWQRAGGDKALNTKVRCILPIQVASAEWQKRDKDGNPHAYVLHAERYITKERFDDEIPEIQSEPRKFLKLPEGKI